MKFRSKELADYIREKRVEAGLTQNELGQKLGYTSQFIANWERGASGPPAFIFPKLIQALKIPKQELLDLLQRETMRYWSDVVRAKKRAG